MRTGPILGHRSRHGRRDDRTVLTENRPAKEGGGLENAIPLQECPKDHKFSVKSIAYLHVYCRKAPKDIVAQFPRALYMADAHLAHYKLNKAA